MPEPIRQLNLLQFAQLLAAQTLSRKITSVHLHHTWRPRHRDFRGKATIEAMRTFHMQTNGWSDIAQHLTIDPMGGLWTGRNWNAPPASSTGRNGTREAGPFMIEMIGDFDTGQDPFAGAQRDAAVRVVATLLDHFELEPGAETLKFHNQLGSPKTCPGTSIDYATLLAEVAKADPIEVPTPRGDRPFAAEHRIGSSVTRALEPSERVLAGSAADEVPEDEAAARDIERLAHASRARAFGPTVFRGADTDQPFASLRRHVVNLSRGELSEGGAFSTTPADLDGIVEGIRGHVASGGSPHVLLYAHGGLVPEQTALDYATTVLPWWRKYGVYPVFFIWESGLLEILRQFVVGPRDIFDFTTDPAIEVAAKGPGTLVWGGMKESARRASAPDASEGNPGGALLFAQRLLSFASTEPRLKVHAVGHSAGAIFHAHLLPVLTGGGATIETLSLLAPAVRTDLFTERLLGLVQDRRIRRLAMFTMQEDAERSDDCFGIYHKSLLYLVSRSFEGLRRRPILGLQESIEKDDDLGALFGLSGGDAAAELQLSMPLGDTPNPLTAALRHGDFDNDSKTMSSVLRRILGEPDESHLGEDDFPFTLKPRMLDAERWRPAPAPVSAAATPTPPRGPQPPAGGGRRLALCVGIDAYPERPLAGCVRDARLWQQSLAAAGFEVRTLFDADATRDALAGAIDRLVGEARPGDVLVFQYSGHGTQMPDDDGDETDRFDEALVPFDYASGRFFIDDDLAASLSRLPAGAALTLFMDCCHSGTNSRFAPLVRGVSTVDERVRYLPPSAELVEAHRQFRRSRSAPAPARLAEESVAGVVHFAACQDNEYAWETQGQGDFTGVAAPLLARAIAGGATNERFLADVRTAVTAKGRQHPLMMRLPSNLQNRPLLAALAAQA